MRIFCVVVAFFIAPVMLSAQWVRTGFEFSGSVTEITSIIRPQEIPGDSTLFAGAYGEGVGIFETKDGGNSWVNEDTGLGSSAVNILVDCSNGTGGYEMFAGTYGDGIFRSSDGGKTWAAANTGLDNKYVNTMLAVPNGSKTYIFAGTDAPAPGHTKPARLYISSDNGDSWVIDTTGIDTPGANVFSLAYATVGTSGADIFMGTYLGGIFRSTNFGGSWQPVDSGLTNRDVRSLFVTPDSTGLQHVFAGTWGGGIYNSSDMGSHWVQSDSGMSDTIVVALAAGGYASGKKKLFAGTASYGLEFSTDFGQSWATSDSGLTDSALVSFAVTDSFLYAGTGGSGIWKIKYSDILAPIIPESTLVTTVNAGWNLLSLPLKLKNSTATAVFPGANSQAFAFEGLYLAVDTLLNGVGYWLHFDSAETVTAIGLPINPETLNVVAGWNLIGMQGFIIPTQDIGASDSQLVATNFYSYSPTGYAVADTLLPWSGYWVKTDSAGQLYLPGVTSKASFKHRLRISHAAAVPPPPPVFTVKTKQLPKVFSLYQNYPNPFNPTTEIRYELAHTSFVSIDVYNILGQRVASLVNSTQPAGDQSVSFNASNLSSGVYFYRIQAGTFEAARKMLVIK